MENEVREAKEKAVETFLNEFFSFNNEERYQTLSEKIDSIEYDGESGSTEGALQGLSDEHQKAYEEYYRAFEEIATQNCIDSMQTNRLPIQFESHITESGTKVKVSDMQYEAADENAYTFEVSFESEDSVFQSPMKGKVTLPVADGQVLVDSVIIHK
uniref:hypothetical protein n=1 Tax=Agathobacter sp. TaxID=2021311 RepID=UPI0040574968